MKRFALLVLLVCASLSQAMVTNPVFRTSGLIVGNNTNRENGALRFLVPYGLQVFYGTMWSNVVGGSYMDYSNTVLNVLGLSLGYTTNAAPEGTLRFNPSTTTLQMYVRSAWTNVVLEDSTRSNLYDQVRTDVNELQTNTVDLVSDQTVAGNKTLMGVLTVSNNVNFGTQNTATGSWAAVLGGGLNDARGAQSVVVGGLDNEAAGAYSIAGGSCSFASGTLSMAVGDNVRAIGDRTVALGRRTRATNDGSFVFGDSQSNLKYDRHADSFNLFFDGGAHLYDTPLYLYDTASNTVVQLSSAGLTVGTNTFSVDSHGNVTATNVSLQFGSSSNRVVVADSFAFSDGSLVPTGNPLYVETEPIWSAAASNYMSRVSQNATNAGFQYALDLKASQLDFSTATSTIFGLLASTTSLAAVQLYTNRAANALDSNTWAASDSTTNYQLRTAQIASNAALQAQIDLRETIAAHSLDTQAIWAAIASIITSNVSISAGTNINVVSSGGGSAYTINLNLNTTIPISASDSANSHPIVWQANGSGIHTTRWGWAGFLIDGNTAFHSGNLNTNSFAPIGSWAAFTAAYATASAAQTSTNAYEDHALSGTNFLITRAMGPHIKISPTNNYQIGLGPDWGTTHGGIFRLLIPSNSFTVTWTPLVSSTWTNIGAATGPWSVIIGDKSSPETNVDFYRLK